MGRSWRRRWPAAASQRHSAGTSAISPMPQSRAERREKSGTSSPASRRAGARPKTSWVALLASKRTVLPAEIRDAADLPGEIGRLPEEPQRRVGADAGRLPRGLVELGCVVHEALGG